MSKLNEFVTKLAEMSETIYAKAPPDTEHMPMAFAEIGGQLSIIGIVHGGMESWREQTRALFEMLARDGATCVAHIQESWMALIPKDDPKRMAKMLAFCNRFGVSKLPPDDRQEVLMVAATDRSGELLMGMRRIIRERERVTLGPLELNEEKHGTTAHSRFLSDLPWKKR